MKHIATVKVYTFYNTISLMCAYDINSCYLVET